MRQQYSRIFFARKNSSYKRSFCVKTSGIIPVRRFHMIFYVNKICRQWLAPAATHVICTVALSLCAPPKYFRVLSLKWGAPYLLLPGGPYGAPRVSDGELRRALVRELPVSFSDGELARPLPLALIKYLSIRFVRCPHLSPDSIRCM